MNRHYILRIDQIPFAEAEARKFRRMDRTLTIEHNGCRFTTDACTTVQGWGTVPVWPIEELLARTDYPPAQAQRIRKLNPYGKGEVDSCVAFVPPPKGT